MVDSSFDLISVIEVRNGKAFQLYSSKSYKTLLGHDPQTCNGDISELTHLNTKHFLTDVMPGLNAAFEAGQVPDGYTGEIKYLHADGYEVPFEFRISIDNANPHRFVNISRDITDRLERQRLDIEHAACHAQLDLFRRFDSSFDLVSLMEVRDGNAYRLYSSKSHKTVLGHDPETCNGDVSKLTHLHPATVLSNELPMLVAAFEANRIPDGYVGETSFLHADGHEIRFEYSTSIDNEIPTKTFVVFRNLTDRLERQRLEVDNARLETERKMDEEAVHTISHQMKNRFYALEGVAQRVRTSVQDSAPHILDGPHNVRESLNDIIGQARGGVRICVNETNVRLIAHNKYMRRDAEFDIVGEFEQLCGTRMDLKIDANVPQRIVSDLSLIMHVIENFTSNAVKYGADGKVLVHVSVLPLQRLRISVYNTPGDKHAELVKRFGTNSLLLFKDGVGVHNDSASTRKGLAIAKKCADVLDGNVNISFEETNVIAALEFSYKILPSSLCLPKSTLIAMVDDNEFVRTVDRSALESMNINVESVRHVRGATADEIIGFPEYVKQMDPQPSIVILDQNLDHPEYGTDFVKGTSLIPRLRTLGFEGKIVIKSANDTPSDAREYASRGADGMVAKGIDAFDMNRQLARILFNTTPPVLLDMDQAIDPRVLEDMSDLPSRHRIVGKFISNANLLVEGIGTAIQKGDYARAKKSVHQLKGSCSYVGARHVEDMCRVIYHSDLEAREWEAAFVDLKDAITPVFECLEKHYKSAD